VYALMDVFLSAPVGTIVEKAEPAELLDEVSKGFLRERLPEALLDATANDIEWCGAVKLLRDEVLHFAEAEKSLRGWILYDDRRAARGRLRPHDEITAQFRRRCHLLSPVNSVAARPRMRC
jgi:hypothetical protein